VMEQAFAELLVALKWVMVGGAILLGLGAILAVLSFLCYCAQEAEKDKKAQG
jgi:hypothetical protein